MTAISNDWVGQPIANERYLITRKIGEGGMGTVYCAHDRNIDAEVVIKVPRQAMLEDPEFARRFTREIRSLVKLSHPRIVKVTDVGDWNGLPFAVMQFLPGGSLEEHRTCMRDGQIGLPEPSEVGHWLSGIAEALDYIHGQGYVHRDVKPANILFDAQGYSFLSDFGVAKVLSTSADTRHAQTAMTGSGMVLGTPEYMAPEVIMGEPFDGRVDQYALGITVYEVLCGRRPFEDEAKTKVLVLQTTKAPPSPSEFRPEIGEGLAAAILRALAKDPRARYPNCVAFGHAVTAAAAEGVSRRDDRVRVKCPACGRSLAMSTGDYAKLKQKLRKVSCPGCKELVVLSAKETVDVAGSDSERQVRGGTMLLALQGQSGEYALASEPPSKRSGTVALGTPSDVPGKESPSQAASGRSGTVALSAQGAAPGRAQEVPRSQTSCPTPPDRGPRPTAPPRDPDGSTPSGKSRPMRATGREPVSAANANAAIVTMHTPQTWVFACGGAALVLVALAVVFKLFAPAAGVSAAHEPNREVIAKAEAPANPVAGAAALANSLAQAETAPTRVSSGVAETQPPRPAPYATTSAKGPTPGRGVSDRPAAVNVVVGRNSAPNPTPDARGTRRSNTYADGAPLPDSATAPNLAVSADSEPWSPDLMQKKPMNLKLTLDSLLKSSQAHAGEVVVPTGMYFVKGRPYARTDGSKYVIVTQRTFEHRGDQLELKAGTNLMLDVVPELANQLASVAADQWVKSPAILSIWITKQGVCRLIKAELLTSWTYKAKAIGYGSVLDIVYTTLVVTPEEKDEVTAADQDWERVDRMLLVANVYKRRFKALKNQKNAIERDTLNAQMASMFNQMVRSTAAAEANLERSRSAIVPTR